LKATEACCIIQQCSFTLGSGAEAFAATLNIHKTMRDAGRNVEENPLEHLRWFVPKVLPLVNEWEKFLTDAANEYHRLMDQNRKFAFPKKGEGVEAVAYGLKKFTPSITDEKERGAKVGILAFIARELGEYTGPGRLHIRGTWQRGMGRLTNWCKALMGLSTYQTERDEERGGRPEAHGTEHVTGKRKAKATPKGPKAKKRGGGKGGKGGGKGGGKEGQVEGQVDRG
jgi:hypothetical protein